MPIKKESIKSPHKLHRKKSESKDGSEEEHHKANKDGIAKSTHRIRKASTEVKADHEDEHHTAHNKGISKTTHRIRKTSSHTKDVHEDEHHLTKKKGGSKPIHSTSSEGKTVPVEDEETENSDRQIQEFSWTSHKAEANPEDDRENKKSQENEDSKPTNGFRWVAEFMAGPGGFLEKTEIVSEWFETLDEAKNNAFEKAEYEISDYPFSRGNILKLSVEDKNGNEIELKNSTKNS